jgi:hypothetical protein
MNIAQMNIAQMNAMYGYMDYGGVPVSNSQIIRGVVALYL